MDDDIQWMLPVNEGTRHKEPLIYKNAKYHCFVTSEDKRPLDIQIAWSYWRLIIPSAGGHCIPYRLVLPMVVKLQGINKR